MQRLRSLRIYISHLLVTVHSRHFFSGRVITLFAWLWGIIWWVWSTVIVGGLLVGGLISLATKGTSGLTNPRTWILIQALLAHSQLSIVVFFFALIITLLALLANYHEKRIIREQEQAHEKSLVVVAEGVRKLLEDQNSKPVASPPSPSAKVLPIQEAVPGGIWNVPFRRNPLFTGREEVLNRLQDQLPTGKATLLTQPQAISGLGGIGKTQTALEYAYRYRDEYQYVLWVRADKREELVTDFGAIAGLLNLPERNAQDQSVVVERVKSWLEGHIGWLLILDNADDLEMASQFIPSGGKGHILLTTRAQAMRNLAQSVEIEKMELEEGALFLLHRAGIIVPDAALDSASTADRAKAGQIVEAMDGLPLALDQAGAYIEETRCNLSSYLDIYEKQKQRVELLRRRGGVDPVHPLPVASTWSLSFKKVEQANPAAADLLRLCAFLSPDAIPEKIITEGPPDLGRNLEAVATDAMKLNDAIGELLKYSLVRRNPDQTLTIHRLVQAVLKDEMNEKMQRRWAERTVRAVNHVFPEAEHKTRDQCELYISHVQVCATLIDQWGITFPDAARLLDQAGYYLFERAQYSEAEPLLLRALAICERVPESEDQGTATSLYHLAELYRVQGKYALAEPLYQRSLAIRERVLGPEDPDTATSLHGFAWLYEREGKYEQAELLYQRSLAIRERVLGPEDPDTATSLQHLGWLYEKQGRYEQAELLYQRALAIRERVLGPEHPDTAANLSGLALLFQSQGKYEQAEPLYQRALVICEQQLGAEHHATTYNLNNLALLYLAQGKYEQAEPILLRTLRIREMRLGHEHRGTATSLNHLAALYERQGKYEQAEPLYQRALSIRENVLGPEHPDTASTLYGLASLYQAKGKYEQAEPLYQGVLNIREKALGPEHPHTAIVLENYANLLRQMKRKREAKAIQKRAKAIRAKTRL